MTPVVLPEIATSKLTDLDGPVSISDASGRVLGTFVPGVIYDPEVYRRNPSPLTPDERKRRLEAGGGKTLAEFWDEMKQKYPDEFK
jgi:hypothetical protein